MMDSVSDIGERKAFFQHPDAHEVQNKLIFDKRDGSQIDFLTVLDSVSRWFKFLQFCHDWMCLMLPATSRVMSRAKVNETAQDPPNADDKELNTSQINSIKPLHQSPLAQVWPRLR